MHTKTVVLLRCINFYKPLEVTERMKRGKHMKKTILILLFGLLTVVGLPMVTEAAEPVDATDATFGAQVDGT